MRRQKWEMFSLSSLKLKNLFLTAYSETPNIFF